MNGYLVICIGVLLAATIARVFVRPERFYEYPYFMAAVFGVFIFPQAISLSRFPGEASPNAVSSVLLMTLLCLAACLAGYRVSASRWIVEHAIIPVDRNRLFYGGIFYVFVAYCSTYMISDMTLQDRGGTMATGKVTLFLFFGGLVYPGLAICLSHALRTRSQSAWLMTAVAAFLPFVAIVFYGRREQAALVVMTIGLTLYFERRLVMPRIAIFGVLVVATLLIPGISQYRVAMASGNVSQLRKFDFVENFERFLNRAPILELRNAAIVIETTQVTGDFGYGRAYWDQMVFRFVPAQLIGRDVKNSLMFKPMQRGKEEIAPRIRYKREPGTTLTGMGDSFHEFWYFGALFFALLAVVFKSLWHASLRRDAIFAQLLYIQTSTAAMRAVTHQTVDYLPGLNYNLIFLGLVVFLARSRVPAASMPAPRGLIRQV